MNPKAIHSEMIVGSLQISIAKKAIKNLNLRILSPHGKVRVSAPLRISNDAIYTFVASKLPWINKQIEKLKNQERESKREYISGESHYFQGKRYLLNIIESSSPVKIEIRNKKYLDLHIKSGISRAKKREIMTEWYRTELKKQIPALLEKWQKIIGVETRDWRIKKMKTRWGTCNVQAKRIWINLELIKKPLNCLEYIIVHELTHLLERSHGKRFVAYMDKFMPQWRSHKNELNKFILTYEEWKRG